MLIEKLWKAVRPCVPLQAYPLLAPAYQWRRRHHLRQLEEDDRRYLAVHPGLRVPPAELRYNVVGPCTMPQFLRGGERTVDDIERALKTVDTSLRQIEDFLDFGCGCGRLVMALQSRGLGLRVTACDVDERAVNWCRRNIDAARFLVNGDLPPIPFADDSYDLIWCGSVFTHLDEHRQDQWLFELERLLKPNGLLLASVQGPHAMEGRVPRWTLARLQEQGILFARIAADAGIHPDWYQIAWHTEEYIKEHWAALIEICAYLPRALNDHQDIVVARKRARRPV